MANDVFANGREIACKAADGKSIAAFPDVCFTPPQTQVTPQGVPIPYPNTAFAKDTAKGSKNVKISGKEVMLKNKSYFKKSTGDEAGTLKGIINKKVSGKVYFTSWSADVKIEGQNVVRHLDLTTHNHGSNPNEGLPWPYIDAMAADASTPQSCKDMVNDIKENCPDGKIYEKKCCNARKCLLLPKEPNQCCNGTDGKQMTGHHPLPCKVFISYNDRKKLKKNGTHEKTGYEPDKAPCLCVDGHTHSKKKEHGKIGCNYTVEKNKWLKANKGESFTLDVGYELGAKSITSSNVIPKGTKGCDEECLKRQLEHGHNEMKKLKVKKNDPLPRVKQPSPTKGVR